MQLSVLVLSWGWLHPENRYMEALAVRKKRERRSSEVAATLTNMAAVWYYESDFDMAMNL